ncbi:hypothetical protein BJ912DRAFT_1057266 [Pholiota molesta]|nr:hypothetical protein BJ912DRAFT_1057266 [Pholiota molesta]
MAWTETETGLPIFETSPRLDRTDTGQDQRETGPDRSCKWHQAASQRLYAAGTAILQCPCACRRCGVPGALALCHRRRHVRRIVVSATTAAVVIESPPPVGEGSRGPLETRLAAVGHQHGASSRVDDTGERWRDELEAHTRQLQDQLDTAREAPGGLPLLPSWILTALSRSDPA